jgi:hypothetical protein
VDLYVLAGRSQPDGDAMKIGHQIRKLGIVLLPVIVVVAAVLGLYSCEVSSISYASYEEAKSRGAIGTHKWLPSLIPTLARDIRESHDVDSNEVWFTFVFDGKFEPPPETCSGVDRGAVAIRKPRRWDRFPEFVRDARSHVLQPGMLLFACQGESYRFFLAVDGAKGQAIGWSRG